MLKSVIIDRAAKWMLSAYHEDRGRYRLQLRHKYHLYEVTSGNLIYARDELLRDFPKNLHMSMWMRLGGENYRITGKNLVGMARHYINNTKPVPHKKPNQRIYKAFSADYGIPIPD
jgi:hypothetical protein